MISRLWRDGKVIIPTSDKVVMKGDRLLVITSEKEAAAMTVLFGEQEHTDWNKENIDWDAIFGKEGVRWFHTGGIFAALSETTPGVVIEALKAAKKY